MRQEMKITVCFGATKIVVPCGTQIPVRELIRQALVRYRKVTNKHADDYIRVHCLQTCEEEAILDEDDTVGDVLDDRDKVIASYEENLVSRPGHSGGDGTSASSVGTASPDIFQGEMNSRPVEGIPVSSTGYSDTQYKKITDGFSNKSTSSFVTYIDSFSPHGSHMNLNVIENHVEDIRASRGLLEGRSSGSDIEGYEGMLDDDNCSDTNIEKDDCEVSAFRREPARKSLKSDHLDRWVDMQESYSEYRRHEPAGAPHSPDDLYTASEPATRVTRQISLALSENEDVEHLNIVLKPTMGENLGITVQGYKTADDRELGLIVFAIDPKGCAARDDRVQVADRIVAVNSQDLTNISNERAEEAFSKALQCETIELSISRSHSFIPESQAVPNSIRTAPGATTKDDNETESLMEEERNTLSPLPNFGTPLREGLSPGDQTVDVVQRIVEKKIFIELQKGSHGLGFSVTTRDNPAGKSCPIYVKNILPHGAAICDGRLQAGDKIIEVDGVQMTGKSQDQVVTLLRSTKGQVKLLVERKVTVTSPTGTKSLIKDMERAPSDSRGNKILTFRIPLPSSGTAGLGITVKGKSSVVAQGGSGGDLGIFVKTVVPGGAAQQDGRLQPDDQLISVNGVKLTGMSNSSAMKTLRSAMESQTLFASVEVTVIRSVKEIMNNVSDLETIQQQNNGEDRAIDVGRTGNEGKDLPVGLARENKGPNWARSTNSQESEITEPKPNCEPTLRDEISGQSSYQGPVMDNNESTDTTSVLKATLNEETTEISSTHEQRDEITNLKPHRRPVKPSNGVHRNHSYYIAMNRGGQRERPSKARHALRKTPFYQPTEESFSQPEQTVEVTRAEKNQRPQIVIASYTDAARVSTPTRAFCISQRPTSTVAEPTAAVSTSTPTRTQRSSAAIVEKKREKPLPTRRTDASRSKGSNTALPIPKGTPPPPPPRTSRPSPYAKQFPNYLPANGVAPRKSDSTFLDYSDGSAVSSNFQSPRERTSDAKVIAAVEVKTEDRKTEKQGSVVSQQVVDLRRDGEDGDHEDNLSDGELGTQEPFLREGFGRQSMSEKRFKLAQADITQTEFYKQRVSRSKSLEGTNQLTVNQPGNNSQTKTLPRPNTTPPDNKTQRLKTEENYSERLIDFSKACKTWSNKDSRYFKDLASSASSLEARGQWRTSSDGIVKKYGRHGNFAKASPLASTRNDNTESSASQSDGLAAGTEDAIPITMHSNADYNSVHPKVKKKQSPFNLKVLGAAFKPKAYKGKYDMQSRQSPDSPSEPRVEFPDEQRYRQLVLGEPRERSFSDTYYGPKMQDFDSEDTRNPSGTRRRKAEQLGKRSSPSSLQDFLKKGSGEYSITESAQI